MLDNIDEEKEIERQTTEEPVHWIRKSTGHWKEIGRAMIQPTFLLILLSATIRQLGWYTTLSSVDSLTMIGSVKCDSFFQPGILGPTIPGSSTRRTTRISTSACG